MLSAEPVLYIRNAWRYLKHVKLCRHIANKLSTAFLGCKSSSIFFSIIASTVNQSIRYFCENTAGSHRHESGTSCEKAVPEMNRVATKRKNPWFQAWRWHFSSASLTGTESLSYSFALFFQRWEISSLPGGEKRSAEAKLNWRSDQELPYML